MNQLINTYVTVTNGLILDERTLMKSTNFAKIKPVNLSGSTEVVRLIQFTYWSQTQAWIKNIQKFPSLPPKIGPKQAQSCVHMASWALPAESLSLGKSTSITFFIK